MTNNIKKIIISPISTPKTLRNPKSLRFVHFLYFLKKVLHRQKGPKPPKISENTNCNVFVIRCVFFNSISLTYGLNCKINYF